MEDDVKLVAYFDCLDRSGVQQSLHFALRFEMAEISSDVVCRAEPGGLSGYIGA